MYRASPGADMGNKLLYAMEHADRILTGFLPSLYYVDLLVGAGIAAVVKILVWQKQADAKNSEKAWSMVQPGGEQRKTSNHLWQMISG